MLVFVSDCQVWDGEVMHPKLITAAHLQQRRLQVAGIGAVLTKFCTEFCNPSFRIKKERKRERKWSYV